MTLPVGRRSIRMKRLISVTRHSKIPPYLWVALSNWISRIGLIAAQLIGLPLLTTLLSPAEFAAYAIAVSLVAWYQLSDLGFGSSVQNHIAEARARGGEVGHFVAAAGLMGGVTLFVAAALLLPLSGLLDHLLLGKLNLPPQTSTRLMLGFSGVLLLGNALGTIAAKMLYALQKGIYANLLSLFNSLAFLALLWGLVRQVEPEHRLLASVLCYTAPLGLTGLAALIWLCARHARWDWLAVKGHFRTLCPRAWRFWVFALMGSATLNVDYLIMSRTLAAEEIAAYSVLFRIYFGGMSLYSGLLTATSPLFSAMGVHGDRAGIERHIHFYLIVGLGSLLAGSVAIAPVLPWILRWLAPGLSIQVPIPTLVLFSIYIGLRIWADTYAVALQALSEVGVFLKIVPVQAFISITMQWALAKQLGINGILLGLMLSYVLTVAWVSPWKLRRHCYAIQPPVASAP